jgi:hypothetical protein
MDEPPPEDLAMLTAKLQLFGRRLEGDPDEARRLIESAEPMEALAARAAEDAARAAAIIRSSPTVEAAAAATAGVSAAAHASSPSTPSEEEKTPAAMEEEEAPAVVSSSDAATGTPPSSPPPRHVRTRRNTKPAIAPGLTPIAKTVAEATNQPTPVVKVVADAMRKKGAALNPQNLANELLDGLGLRDEES